MQAFERYTLDTVPASGRETLQNVEKKYGFVPNLMANMVASPAAANAYLDLGRHFADTSFSAAEQQVVLLTISRENACEYCVGAHTVVAGKSGVADDAIAAIRDGRPIDEPKLEALRRFTKRAVETRGWLRDDDLEAFYDAGYGPQQVLEVVLGIAMKTLSNYTNHIAGTELDEAFESGRWQAPDSAAA